MEKLLDILMEINPDIDYAQEKHLIDDGFMDSLEIVTIVLEASNAFHVEFEPADIIPENFNSAESIWALIQKYQSASI